jgi:hypothetical protein
MGNDCLKPKPPYRSLSRSDSDELAVLPRTLQQRPERVGQDSASAQRGPNSIGFGTPRDGTQLP